MTNDEASEAVVSYEVSEETARIMLARAPVNALSFEMIRAVIAAMERAADDRAARVVVSARGGGMSLAVSLIPTSTRHNMVMGG